MKPQAFVLALIAVSLMLILTPIVDRTDSGLLRDVVHWLSFGAFVPFGLAFGSSMTKSKALLVTTTVVIVLIAAPRGVQAMSRAVAPLGVGVLIGAGLRSTIKEETHEPPSA